nr:3-hydroxyacyl-CoA dehydrogenase NAD-binding domain-containing protein [Bacillus subtilis]
MHKHIRKATVLGSGVMGSGIAAHLANIGIPVPVARYCAERFDKGRGKKGADEGQSGGAQAG